MASKVALVTTMPDPPVLPVMVMPLKLVTVKAPAVSLRSMPVPVEVTVTFVIDTVVNKLLLPWLISIPSAVAPVTTIGSGWVASAGTHIFLAAPKERRVCLPNTRFMIHQPSGGAGGRASDIAIQAQEIIKMRERIARVIAKETGQKLERVLVDIDRDHWMSAQEAIEYGLVSRVIAKQSELA